MNKKKGILTILKELQQKEALTEEALLRVSEERKIPLNELYGVASFYSFLGIKPKAKYTIRLCKSISCHMKKSSEILEVLQDKLGIAPGEATKDEKFFLELVNCIGACDIAPAMLINDKPYGNLNSKKIAEIIDGYK
ncbi:MAG: NAD(P)H-dependent oxidoreductase subunit E [Candidatus Omnitrophota bacterium]